MSAMRCWTRGGGMTDTLPSLPEAAFARSELQPEGRARVSFARAFAAHRLGVAGLVLIVLLLAFCFLGPFVYHTDQVHTNLEATNLAPGHGHLLGNDGS